MSLRIDQRLQPSSPESSYGNNSPFRTWFYFYPALFYPEIALAFPSKLCYPDISLGGSFLAVRQFRRKAFIFGSFDISMIQKNFP
ncbi:hypothetical protein D3Z62_17035 [Lachnospiraceae bacterium]|nr:hypothetical protein [Lachnospiraceae bacterium]